MLPMSQCNTLIIYSSINWVKWGEEFWSLMTTITATSHHQYSIKFEKYAKINRMMSFFSSSPFALFWRASEISFFIQQVGCWRESGKVKAVAAPGWMRVGPEKSEKPSNELQITCYILKMPIWWIRHCIITPYNGQMGCDVCNFFDASYVLAKHQQFTMNKQRKDLKFYFNAPVWWTINTYGERRESIDFLVLGRTLA